MTEERKLGLIKPPAGFVSAFAPASEVVPVLDWATIQRIAKSGKMDGHKKYGTEFVSHQRHNNCASAATPKPKRHRP